MDWLADQVESITKQASELTMYDVKTYVNKAKNMVLNLSEIETKVREATNDDTWGASSTLMQEIAQSTFDFQLFNEIMPTIYARFTDKEARQWRQIYKALVLLEYLVKNGSERVVDDARQHLSLIKVLRNFHYIDENGKDQGINVRNRSKELAELLQDLDKVRQERRKAKHNRNKYQGISNEGIGGGGGGMSFSTSSGSRYGGFGSESMHGDTGFSGGYSGSASTSGGFRDSRNSGNQDFEEYDAGEWEESDRPRRNESSSSTRDIGRSTSSRSNGRTSTTGSSSRTMRNAVPPKVEPPKQEVNLFDLDDDDEQTQQLAQPSPTPPPKFTSTMPTATTAVGDDDFDDFQSASEPVTMSSSATTSKPHQNVFDLLNAAQPNQSSSTMAPNVRPLNSSSSSSFGGGLMQPQQVSRPTLSNNNGLSSSSSIMSPTTPAGAAYVKPTTTTTTVSNSKPTSSTDFSDLFGDFNSVMKPSSNTGATTRSTMSGQPKLTLAQIQQQKAQDKLFATSSSSSSSLLAQRGNAGASTGGNNSMGGWDSLI
ncbi:Epsin-3, clathrin recruitment and traffic between the Golgi and endosome [Microbotryomycetes sp. JL221]|nr:Epsin-3, clathrin recruitment and traffic between the Golgi and endosome [Microbotryomycetes sp. JL221]